jgi:hypothetical protein
MTIRCTGMSLILAACAVVSTIGCKGSGSGTNTDTTTDSESCGTPEYCDTDTETCGPSWGPDDVEDSDPCLTTTRIDSTFYSEETGAIAIGADGYGLVSYSVFPFHGCFDFYLRMAHCENEDCSKAGISTISTENGFMGVPSMAMGSDGKALISYHTWQCGPTGHRKVAHCDDAECSSATVTALDDKGVSGPVAIGDDGFGVIVFRGNDPAEWRVTHCQNLGCTKSTTSVLEKRTSASNIGIARGSDGMILVAYGQDDHLRVAHCDNAACTSATITALGSGMFVNDWEDVAMTVGKDGYGFIVYGWEGNLMAAHCQNVACSKANIVAIEGALYGDYIYALDMETDQNGLPVMAIVSSDKGETIPPKVVRCLDPDCSSTEVKNSPSYIDTVFAIRPNGRFLMLDKGEGKPAKCEEANLVVMSWSGEDCWPGEPVDTDTVTDIDAGGIVRSITRSFHAAQSPGGWRRMKAAPRSERVKPQ